ncbi:AbiTii domain-containing protein [Vibrio diabolicus]|uniref:AbiTii domain-containing protein n=1 Tax=Vibrio diabolicus TaxID=50719 RepID=UPI00375147AC
MEEILATSEGLKEALSLSESIISDIELNIGSLSNIALKASRLARLIGHFDHQKIFLYEVSGYPTTPNGVDSKTWALARTARRINKHKDDEGTHETASLESLEQLHFDLEAAKDSLAVAQDADVALTSANPKQYISAPVGNKRERDSLRRSISKKSKFIAKRRAFIYEYVSSVHYEIKYSAISNDIFSRIRSKVDEKVGSLIPDSVQKFTAVYENLRSENTEDWSNAVHSCRRILQDTADVLYPAREPKVIEINGKERKIKLGPDNYINRLMAYVEENVTSKRFEEIVGSHMKYLGERLDSIFQAAQKGSHDVISSQDEADRYVIYTYLVVGDILQLKAEVEQKKVGIEQEEVEV